MSRLDEDVVHIAAPPERIRFLLHDPDALRRVLPGCESLDATGADAYRGVLAVRIQFMTLRAEVSATIDDDGDGPVRLLMSGRPRGLAGTFSIDVPFDLVADGDGTRISYQVDLVVSGRLAAFGKLILRDTTRRQIARLVQNVDRELEG